MIIGGFLMIGRFWIMSGVVLVFIIGDIFDCCGNIFEVGGGVGD